MYKTMGEYIKAVRLQNNLSRLSVEKQVGISSTKIYECERGIRDLTQDELLVFTACFGIHEGYGDWQNASTTEKG